MMETYQRRRFRKCKESISGLDQPGFRTGFPASDHFPEYQLKNTDIVDYNLPAVYHFDCADRVEVGSVYVIDHHHLPVRTPAHLRSIRVAMVSEKTKLNVAVRYPSPGSLETFFSNSIGEMYPALDEKFVMGTALATKVLARQVPTQQFAENKHLKQFWLAGPTARKTDGIPLITSPESDDSYRKGNCLTELMKGGGMVRWGTRRQVKFLKKHTDIAQSSSSLCTKATESTEGGELPDEIPYESEDDANDEEEAGDDDDDDDDEQKDDETEDNKDVVAILDEDMEDGYEEMEINLKRKRYMLRKSVRNNAEKPKVVKKKKKQHLQKKKKTAKTSHKRNRCRELLVVDNPKDRWSAERYQAATENLLAVMKAKKATASNPILRPNLREEARKRIGDTGLLDHLLKHMAGALAPDGEVRFRRRHNADGAMEYWLESADLVNIRLKAGVDDPYWVPPPGWEPGDSPTQDPILAKELKLLKQEVSQLKRNVKAMVPRKQMEKELRKLRREMDRSVTSKQLEVSSKPSFLGQKLNQLASLLDSTKSEPASMEKYNEQLLAIQAVLTGIQAELKNSQADGKEKMDVELKCTTPKELQVVNVREDQDSVGEMALERQKSGFRLYKPQGTFQWPNMTCNNSSDTVIPTVTSTTSTNVSSSQVVVQFEDLFAVPTPSLSSSTTMVPPQLPYHPNSVRPSSPVKPLAEKRAVTVTVSRVTNDKGDQTTTSPMKHGPKINLNATPSNSIIRPAANPRTSVMPQTGSGDWELIPGETGSGEVHKKLRKYPSVSTPCISEKNLGTWLALGTANSASRTPAKESGYRDVLNLSTE